MPPFRKSNLDGKTRRDRARDFVLQVEQLFELDIETVRPERAFGRSIDQLDRDAQPLAAPTQAAAENVAGAQSSLNLLRGRGVEAEQKSGMARDHHQVAKPRQVGDDVLGDALAEMVVARIPRKIGKREHGDRRRAKVLQLGFLTRASRAGRKDGFRAIGFDREYFGRLGNILQVLGSQRTQADPGDFAHRVPDPGRDQDAIGLRERLDSRRDVDAMTVHVAFVHRDLAEIEADAELDRLAVAPYRLVAELRLNLNCEPQRPVGAVEQRKNAVARDVGDMPAVVADQRLEKVDRPGGLNRIAGVVLLEALAVLDHIGEHDGGKLLSTLATIRR